MIQTDKAIMRCNGRFYWAIATIGFVAASTTAFGALTQEEVDRIVDNEIIMCEHEEDADAIEKSLKERGATDEMLAHGYYFVMEKTKNAEKGSLDSEKFHSAAAIRERNGGCKRQNVAADLPQLTSARQFCYNMPKSR